MTQAPQVPTEALPEIGRRLRDTYDRLDRGERATLRRCTTVDEMLLEGAFWRLRRLAGADDRDPEEAAQVVVLFPSCEARVGPGFTLGRFLFASLNAEQQRATKTPMRLRQLLACRDRDALVHRLRRLLTAIGKPVDWGALYADLSWWRRGEASRDRVARRWVRDFFDDNSPDAPDAHP